MAPTRSYEDLRLDIRWQGETFTFMLGSFGCEQFRHNARAGGLGTGCQEILD